MTETVEKATVAGITNAKTGMPDDSKEAALAFFYEYATNNRYFTGGDVLSAWRETLDPRARLDWRNRWGVVCKLAHQAGWLSPAGRAKPTTRQSHSRTLVLWESLVCTNSSAVEQYTDQHKLNELHQRVISGQTELRSALDKAYAMGTEI